jgi:nitrogen-specific signal transduction histidine kinase
MPQAFNKEIELSYSIDEEYKPMFSSYSCDAAKLKHAVTNLLKNAFEAVQSGGLYILNLNINQRVLPHLTSSP